LGASADGTHFLIALSRNGLLSFRAFSSLLDVGKDFSLALDIGSILYGVAVSRGSNHALKNMSDLDLSHGRRLSKNLRRQQKKTTHLEHAMCCQAPNRPPTYIPELGLDDLRGESMHANVDKTKDSLDNFTISCSERGLTALRIDVRYSGERSSGPGSS